MGQASRDVTTKSTGSSELYGMASNKTETTPIYQSTYRSPLDPKSHHDGRLKVTDEGICLPDEDEGDEEPSHDDISAEERDNEVEESGGKTVNDDVSAEERDNEVEERGGKTVNDDANKGEDKNVNNEIEEESERGREHKSERRTNGYASNPIKADCHPHLLTLSGAAAGLHEVQIGECFYGMKLILGWDLE